MKKKKYLPPSLKPLSGEIAFTQSCVTGPFGPAGCQAGIGDSVYCLVGVSVGAVPCSSGSSPSAGGCSAGVGAL